MLVKRRLTSRKINLNESSDNFSFSGSRFSRTNLFVSSFMTRRIFYVVLCIFNLFLSPCGRFILSPKFFSKWQTKEDQPVVVEEDLAVVEGAVGVVPGEVGEESPRTKMYAPAVITFLCDRK